MGGPGGDWAGSGVGRSSAAMGPGDDLVVVRRDGIRDHIDCGDGDDLAAFLGGRDPSDRFFHCEHKRPFSEVDLATLAVPSIIRGRWPPGSGEFRRFVLSLLG